MHWHSLGPIYQALCPTSPNTARTGSTIISPSLGANIFAQIYNITIEQFYRCVSLTPVYRYMPTNSTHDRTPTARTALQQASMTASPTASR